MSQNPVVHHCLLSLGQLTGQAQPRTEPKFANGEDTPPQGPFPITMPAPPVGRVRVRGLRLLFTAGHAGLAGVAADRRRRTDRRPAAPHRRRSRPPSSARRTTGTGARAARASGCARGSARPRNPGRITPSSVPCLTADPAGFRARRAGCAAVWRTPSTPAPSPAGRRPPPRRKPRRRHLV